MTKKLDSDESSEDQEPKLVIDGADQVLAEALAGLEKNAPQSPEGVDFKDLLAKKDERLKEYHDRYLRMAADFENYKKRQRKEREEWMAKSQEYVILEFLPILDSFDRTLDHLTTATDLQSVKDGIGLVHRQTLSALEKFHVKPMQSTGESFNPTRHEALAHEVTTDVPAGHVSKEGRKGYWVGERVLRPAQVVVAKSPDSNPTTPSEASDLKLNDAEKSRMKC